MDKTTEKNNESKKLHWGNARIAFLAQQEEIKAMLAKGHPQIAIYKELGEHLNGMSYCQFSHLIRKNIMRTSNTPQPAAESMPIGKKNENTSKRNMSQSPFRGFVPGPKVPDLNELF